MGNYIAFILAFVPIIAEIAFDKWMWSKGKSDKPLSTGLRMPFMYIILVAIGYFNGHNMEWWGATAFVVITHIALFDPVLNLCRGLDIDYHTYDNWYERFWMKVSEAGTAFYVAVRLLMFYVGWVIGFHPDWITGNYPNRLIEFFMF